MVKRFVCKNHSVVREAIEQHDWKEANEQIIVVANTIEKIAAEIEKAAALL